MKDLYAVIVFLIPFAWFVFFAPDILNHPDNFIMANSQVTPTHIVPEWYLLPFYTMLRAIDFNVLFIDSKLGGVLVMGGSLLILFVLPWLDRSPVRSGTFRPVFKWFYWLFVLNFLMLVYLGAQDPSVVIYNYLAKLGTAYYFIYFLIILPVLSRIETPRPLPVSISQSVLGKAHS
jgi:ubiquinol-cytochrome c reductase cytochrome b subunit